ncbi:MAG TPA: VOC family protein [Candidatus Acidoferrum sp.]|nr:VOC family protein [Candidatus Acidoferrum sp.]
MSDHPWPLHSVTLKVLHLPAQIAFYRQFGFCLATDSSPSSATLTAGDFHLTLIALTDGKPRPPRTAGLFHFAILLPDRHSLGSFVRHAARHRWDFAGAADHLVSEALYFSDPEGNGIEVYADRPRENWQWQSDQIAMDTLPLDLESFAALDSREWSGFPAATRLGHMHLTVSDLAASQSFYESLGLHLTANWGAFRFLAWDNYHHHIALNLLAGPHAAAVSPQISGLAGFSVQRDTLATQMWDPSHIVVVPRNS